MGEYPSSKGVNQVRAMLVLPDANAPRRIGALGAVGGSVVAVAMLAGGLVPPALMARTR